MTPFAGCFEELRDFSFGQEVLRPIIDGVFELRDLFSHFSVSKPRLLVSLFLYFSVEMLRK
jgi:hypothetical protein